MAERVAGDLPLAVLGGYLGAGKTTLLNQLLREASGQRIGVLVNDFGEVNIDEALIENRDGETLSLSNGCVCCSIQSDLGLALERMKRMPVDFDQVIVEASGAADPARVAETARTWPGYRWGGAFVVVDAQQAPRLIQDKFVGRHVGRQIAHANVLTLSKLDLLSEEEADEARRWLESLAGGTPILEEIRSLPELLCGEAQPVDAESASLALESASFRCEEALEIPALLVLLQSLDARVLRVKGFVRGSEGGTFVVQKVGTEVEIAPLRTVASIQAPRALVFLAVAGFGPAGFGPIEDSLAALATR